MGRNGEKGEGLRSPEVCWRVSLTALTESDQASREGEVPDGDPSTCDYNKNPFAQSGRVFGECDLLCATTGNVDAFVAVDKNLVHQQTLAALPCAVVVLVSCSNRRGDLLPLVPDILAALDAVAPGQVPRAGGG